LIGTGQQFQREMTGTICETIHQVNTESDRETPWHFFTGSPFGLRWESIKERTERFLKYFGKDRKTLRMQEAIEGFNDLIADATLTKAQKVDIDNGEE